jgi:hypothetical protein
MVNNTWYKAIFYMWNIKMDYITVKNVIKNIPVIKVYGIIQ